MIENEFDIEQIEKIRKKAFSNEFKELVDKVVFDEKKNSVDRIDIVKRMHSLFYKVLSGIGYCSNYESVCSIFFENLTDSNDQNMYFFNYRFRTYQSCRDIFSTNNNKNKSTICIENDSIVHSINAGEAITFIDFHRRLWITDISHYIINDYSFIYPFFIASKSGNENSVHDSKANDWMHIVKGFCVNLITEKIFFNAQKSNNDTCRIISIFVHLMQNGYECYNIVLPDVRMSSDISAFINHHSAKNEIISIQYSLKSYLLFARDFVVGEISSVLNNNELEKKQRIENIDELCDIL